MELATALKPPLLLRYVFREILHPFWISLFVFTGILFLGRSVKLVDLVVNKNIPLPDILLLFSYVIPSFLEVAIPMALLLSTILAFGRLSADSELVVIRAAGISLRQLAGPVIAAATACFVLTLVLTLWIRPWATYQLGLGMFAIAKVRASAGLSDGIFNDFGNLTIYAERVDRSGHLTNVLISDRREPEKNRTFIAKYGRIVSDVRTRSLALQLYEGSIQEGSGLHFTVTYFEVNSVSLPYSDLFDDAPAKEGKKSKELYIGELLHQIDNSAAQEETLARTDMLQLARWRTELHRRLGLPFSCFCVALVAMALGIQPSRGGKSWGTSANVTLGIVLILVYYLLIALASAIAEQALVPVALAMWVPNAAFLALGIYLFRMVGSERWTTVSTVLGEIGARLLRRTRRLVRAQSAG